MKRKLERIRELRKEIEDAQEKGLYFIAQNYEKKIKRIEEEMKEERFKQMAMRSMPWD